MKKSLFFALLFPSLAIGARPEFGIPEDAYTSHARCTVEKSTRTRLEKGWSDWLNEKSAEDFRYSFWLTPEAVNTLKDRGHQITLTEMKEVSKSDFKIQRTEKVEEWLLGKDGWKLVKNLVQVTIHKRQGNPNLHEEHHEDGRVFHWEASVRGTHVVKNLLNPGILNTPARQVGLLRTTCRH